MTTSTHNQTITTRPITRTPNTITSTTSQRQNEHSDSTTHPAITHQ